MELRRILIIDTETDGTDDVAQCIEAACILYDVPRAASLTSFSSLIRAQSNAAEQHNGIPYSLLADAPPSAIAWAPPRELAKKADALIAHNADFDRRFVPTDVGPGLPWICSMDDLLWPKARKSADNLVSLALSHGLGVAVAHRALSDCELLARLLTRVHEMGIDLQAFLARGLRPKALFQALVPFERKDEAKSAGFRWNEDGTKRWLRRMAIEDAAALPFQTRQAAS